MKYILGLDVGTIRVGSAVADLETRIPFPGKIWNRANGEAEREILKVVAEKKIELLVVGLPLNAKDERTPICTQIEAFMRRISKRCSVTIKYVDESYSTLEARESLTHRRNQKRFVDSEAACNILSRFLESSEIT